MSLVFKTSRPRIGSLTEELRNYTILGMSPDAVPTEFYIGAILDYVPDVATEIKKFLLNDDIDPLDASEEKGSTQAAIVRYVQAHGGMNPILIVPTRIDNVNISQASSLNSTQWATITTTTNHTILVSNSSDYKTNDVVYVSVNLLGRGSGVGKGYIFYKVISTNLTSLTASVVFTTADGQAGTQGATGPQGAQGAQGAASTVAGPQGDTGPQGPAGTGVAIKADKASCTTAGDSYIADGSSSNPGTVGHLYVLVTGSGDSGTYTDAGEIKGPQGPQGVTGAQGSTGPQGDTGPQGATGPQGTNGSLSNAEVIGITSIQIYSYDSTAIDTTNGISRSNFNNVRNWVDVSFAYDWSYYGSVVSSGNSVFVKLYISGEGSGSNTYGYLLISVTSAQREAPYSPNGRARGTILFSCIDGTVGPQGISGAQGPQGPQGPAGGGGGGSVTIKNLVPSTGSDAITFTRGGQTYTFGPNSGIAAYVFRLFKTIGQQVVIRYNYSSSDSISAGDLVLIEITLSSYAGFTSASSQNPIGGVVLKVNTITSGAVYCTSQFGWMENYNSMT